MKDISYQDCVDYAFEHPRIMDIAKRLFPFPLRGGDYHIFSVGFAYAKLLSEPVAVSADDVQEIQPNTMDAVEKSTIEDALVKCNQNREEAARMLGISARTIYRKIKQYEI